MRWVSGVHAHRVGTTFVVAPEPPRSVKVTDRLNAEKLENPVSVRRTDATLSISNDVLVGSHADICKHLPQFSGFLDRRNVATGVKVDPLKVD